MEEENRESITGLSAINFLIGAWFIVSPYILGYSSSASKWNQTLFGIAVLILSAIRFLAPRANWASVLNGIIGIWMMIAPFILSYNRSVAYWNEIVFGALLTLIAFSNNAIHAPTHRQNPTV